MYIDKNVKNGYSEYICTDVNDGEHSMMDVALLIMDEGDTYVCGEPDKELAWILLKGKAAVDYAGGHARIERPDPFDYNPYCLHISAGDTCKLTALGHCEIYIQKIEHSPRVLDFSATKPSCN